MSHAASSLVFPAELRARAQQLLVQDQRTRHRQSANKRYQPGISGGDLEGFSLNGQALQLSQLPQQLLASADRSPVADRQPGRIQPQDQSARPWLELAAELYTQFPDLVLREPSLRSLLEDFRDTGELPSWLLDFASHKERQFLNLQFCHAFRKEADNVEDQAAHRESLLSQRPGLARYYLPLIPFEIEPGQFLAVMPCLSEFVTLDDLMCSAAGLRELPGPAIRPEELPEVLRAVVEQLAEILWQMTVPPVRPDRDWRGLLEALHRRFATDNPVSILVNDLFLRDLAEDVLRTVEARAPRLWETTRDYTTQFGHGDLNATNIMVAVRRDSTGGISEVCVRLIDPNPTSIPGHSLLELARLIHWLELGSALSLSRRRGSRIVQVDFQGSSVDEDFLRRPPRLRWSAPEREALGPVYQTFLHVLLDSIPALRQPAARDLLSLGVGTYHLVATHYWPGNVDRTAAFWAGVFELNSTSQRLAATGDNGLWTLRRRFR